MHDTVLSHAHVYWHADAWHAIGATLQQALPCGASGSEGVPRLIVAPRAGIGTIYINYASATGEEGASPSVVFELDAASAAGAAVEILRGGGDGGPADHGSAAGIEVGVECEDDGWLLT